MKQKTQKTQEEFADKGGENLFSPETVENAEQVIPIDRVAAKNTVDSENSFEADNSAEENYPRVAIRDKSKWKLAPLTAIVLGVLSISVFALIGSTVYGTSAEENSFDVDQPAVIEDFAEQPAVAGSAAAVAVAAATFENAPDAAPEKISAPKKIARKTVSTASRPVKNTVVRTERRATRPERFEREIIIDREFLRNFEKISKKRFERFRKESKKARKARKNRDDDDDDDD